MVCSASSSNISETDSRSSSTAVAGGAGVSSRKRSRKDTAGSSKSSSHECRRLSQRIAHVLRKQKLNVSDSDTAGKDDNKDDTEIAT